MTNHRGNENTKNDFLNYLQTSSDVGDDTTPLLDPRPSSFQSSLPSEDVGQYEVIGPYTRNAADAEAAQTVDPDDALFETHPVPRRNRRGRKLFESWDSAKHFVKAQGFTLSTHSTIESGAHGLYAKSSNLQTLMNLIKGTAGTGILTLPLAFKYSGLWTGLVLFFVIAAVAVHAMHMMVRCASILERRSRVHIRDYADTVEQCFTYGPAKAQRLAVFMRCFVDGLIYVIQCGFCCIYIVWIAVNVKQVFETFWPSSPDVRIYEVAVYLLLLPYIMVKSLRTLAIFSAIANLIYLVGLIIIYQFILQDLLDASSLPAFNSWGSLPRFFGTAVFSFESICLVLPLRSKIQNESDFGGWTGVLNLGMVIITTLYAATGFYGYLRFGEDIASTITLNLPQDQWLYLSVNLMFAAALFVSVGVQFYVPINVLWPAIERRMSVDRSEKCRKLTQYLVRGILFTLILAIAIVVPHLELLMSLVGSIFGSMLAMILPSVVEILTLYEEGELSASVVVKDAFIIVFGILGFATGGYTSLVDIIDTF